MRQWTAPSTLFSFAVLPLSLVVGCGGDDGDSVRCGPGTSLEDGVCVADGTGDGEAPTVASIEPASGLVGGGEPFTITGSGFDNGGETVVSFGDSVASFEIVSDTEITGVTPRASAAAVTVTVENAFGSATADFAYRGLYGADGKGAVAGNLYLVDPRDGTSVVIGPIESDEGPHAVTGLAFDAEGTLWATDATSGLDEGPAPDPQLMTIDPATGHATLVGPLLQGASTRHRSISAITFVGSTLLGWTRSGDAPVSIDTATGAVSLLGAGLGQASFGNGLVAMDDQAAVVFPAGASDGAGIRGHFYSVDADGELADIGVLGGTGSASVCGATLFRGTVFALLCPHLADLSGSVLATVDPGDGTITNVAPSALGLDAIASDEPLAPASGRFLPPAGSPDLVPEVTCSPAVRVTDGHAVHTLAAGQLAAQAGSTAVRTRRGDARGLPLADAAGARDLQVVSCGGASLAVASADASRYALVENSRGLIKLVDTATGRTLLRGVIEVRLR
jgi:hypothetical protein